MSNITQEQITNSINETLKEVKNIIDADTIIGKTILTNEGYSIIPISKVIVGYIGGGGEYFNIKVKKNESPFASGCGTGAYIKPIGFLIISQNENIKYIEVNNDMNLEKIAEHISNLIKTIKGK